MSPFVHGVNVDWDFDETRDNTPFLRDPIEWDGANLRAPLGLVLFRLHEIATNVVADRLRAQPLSNAELHEQRKNMLRDSKAGLHEILVALVAAFPADPIEEAIEDPTQTESEGRAT